MESISECFARNLRQLRKDRGLTQEALAQACDLSLVFLQNLEAGRRWVSPATVAALATSLKVAECDFFKAKEEHETSEWNHVPEDVRVALMSVCRHPSWPWDIIRTFVLGFEHAKSPYRKAVSTLAHPVKAQRGGVATGTARGNTSSRSGYRPNR